MVVVTVEVGVQGDHFTFASRQLRSIDLKVATQLNDVELSGGLATVLGSRHSIDTGNRGGLNSIICIGGETSGASPRIGSIRNLSSRQGSRGTLADHVVTRNGDFGDGSHCNSVAGTSGGNTRRSSADRVSRSSHKGVVTSFVHIHSNDAGVFTGNKHTVHIPVIETSVSTGTANRSSSSHLVANTHGGRIDRHIESGSFGSDHMDNDGANVLTSSRGSSFHLVSLVTGNIIADRHHEGGTADSEIGFTGLFPSVGDVLVGPTIQVSVKNNRGTRTYIIFRSGELQVGTELIDGEVSSGSTTSSRGSGHIVSARSSTFHFVATRSRRSHSGFRPTVGGETRSSSQDIGSLTVADHIVTIDGEGGSALSGNRDDIGQDLAAVVVRVVGFHIEVVHALGEGGGKSSIGGGGHKLTILIPFVRNSAEIIIRDRGFISHVEGKFGTGANGGGGTSNCESTGNGQFIKIGEVFSGRIGSASGGGFTGGLVSTDTEVSFHRPIVFQI